MQKERWLNQKIGWTISVMLMLSPRKIKTYLFIFFLSFSIFSWKKISQKWYLQISVKVNKELSNNRIVQNALNLKAWSLKGLLFLGHTEQIVLFQPKNLVCLFILSLLFNFTLVLDPIDFSPSVSVIFLSVPCTFHGSCSVSGIFQSVQQKTVYHTGVHKTSFVA